MSESESAQSDRLTKDASPKAENAALEIEDRSPRLSILAIISRMLLYSIALTPILLFLASLLGRYFLICELICNFRAYILITLVISSPVLLLLRRKWLNAVWLGATLWAMMGTVSVFLPTAQSTIQLEDAQTVKIMSFNVLGHNPNHADAISEIKRHDPDVLVVLEYANRWEPALERLHTSYPHRLEQPRWHGFGIAIFSKLPLDEQTILQLSERRTDNPFAVATVRVGDRQLRIAGTHLLSPMNSERLGIRNQQMREIGEFLALAKVPTILVGDFNCVPWSAFLSDFLHQTGYRDSRQGFGYDGTWHAKRSFLRIPIDHAFVSRQVHVFSRTVGGSTGSDHFPIVLEVSVE